VGRGDPDLLSFGWLFFCFFLLISWEWKSIELPSHLQPTTYPILLFWNVIANLIDYLRHAHWSRPPMKPPHWTHRRRGRRRNRKAPKGFRSRHKTRYHCSYPLRLRQLGVYSGRPPKLPPDPCAHCNPTSNICLTGVPVLLDIRGSFDPNPFHSGPSVYHASASPEDGTDATSPSMMRNPALVLEVADSFPFIWDTGALATSEGQKALRRAVANCSVPRCASCQLGKAKRRPSDNTTSKPDASHNGALEKENLLPRKKVSVDNFICSTKGILYNSTGNSSPEIMHSGGHLFVDHATGPAHVEHQIALTSHETLFSKQKFKAAARDCGVIPQAYLSDKGKAFSSDTYTLELSEHKQVSLPPFGNEWSNDYLKNQASDRQTDTIRDAQDLPTPVVPVALPLPPHAEIPTPQDVALWIPTPPALREPALREPAPREPTLLQSPPPREAIPQAVRTTNEGNQPRRPPEPAPQKRSEHSTEGLHTGCIDFSNAFAQALLLWFEHPKAKIEKRGFRQSKSDPCLLHSGKTYLVCCVDRIAMANTNVAALKGLILNLQPDSVLTEEGELSVFRGIQVDQKEGEAGQGHCFTLTQSGLTTRIIVALGLTDAKPAWTPTTQESFGSGLDSSLAKESWNYRPLSDMPLYLSPTGNLGVDCYVDADFAGFWLQEDQQDPLSVKSRTGYLISIGGCLPTRTSKLQTEVALLTEYIALPQSMRELFPFRELVQELSTTMAYKKEFEIRTHSKVFEDNNGALILASSPRMSPRSKHIAVKYRSFRSHVADGSTKILKITTEGQKADILTKEPVRAIFESIRLLVMVDGSTNICFISFESNGRFGHQNERESQNTHAFSCNVTRSLMTHNVTRLLMTHYVESIQPTYLADNTMGKEDTKYT
jgi:hypothetical protein